MHSKHTSRSMLRMTPYLITVGLGFSVAANAATSQAEEKAKDRMAAEIPAPTIDTNGDGKADAWDRSGNGKPDTWDTKGDGKPDIWDRSGDGKPDAWDTNGDGKPDLLDDDGDGKPD